tara:strand:- start:218 stop:514 length:297 start_codon:yes stop_codon:yes gene_type:complete
MIEWAVAKLGMSTIQYATGGALAVVVAWVLKKIPNKAIKAQFGMIMYGMGVTCTLGMGKWKYTKRIWNKTVEPYFVDLLDNLVAHGTAEFVRGLRSDN